MSISIWWEKRRRKKEEKRKEEGGTEVGMEGRPVRASGGRWREEGGIEDQVRGL